MGHKVHPNGFRLGIYYGYSSNWFVKNNEAIHNIKSDYIIRQFINSRLYNCAISRIEIERVRENIHIGLFTGKPGFVIGKNGVELDKLTKDLNKKISATVFIEVMEVVEVNLDARLVASNITDQLSRRVMYRKAAKRAVQDVMRAGALGVKVLCAGRLGGAEMSHTETYKEGRMPLHTISALIDYHVSEANTNFGRIGVKVWIYLADGQYKNKSLLDAKAINLLRNKKSRRNKRRRTETE